MALKHKSSGKAFSLPAALALGVGANLLATLAATAVSAYLISGEKVSKDALQICVTVTLLAGSMLGALTTAGLFKRMRLQMCLLSGGCYYVCLLGMTALLFDGSYTGMLRTAITVLAGSALAAAMGALPKNGRKATVRKKAYR